MRRRTLLAVILAGLVGLGAASPADAHWADQSVAEVVVLTSSVRVTVTLPAVVLHGIDAHSLPDFFADHLRMTDGSGAGAVRVESIGTPADGKFSTTHATVQLTYSWPRPLQNLTIRYDLFPVSVATASCLATIVRGGSVQTFVFTPQSATLDLGAGWATFFARVGSFVVLGIEHILTGYDHILFLLSLLMLGGTLRSLVRVVSAFTAAHSITLSLAALNVISLPGRWVESAIALSIVVVAAENVFRSGITLRQRWAVTFAFGLVHGLGFATILRDLALPRPALVSSLVGFNVGVEVGQIVIVVAAYAMLRLLSRWPRALQARRWVSASAALVGLVWFVQRAFVG